MADVSDELQRQVDRLPPHLDELRDLILEALQIAERSPAMALTQARKSLEWMVRQIYESGIGKPAGTQALDNLLRDITREGYLTRRIAAHANSVRELGNVGAHVPPEPVTRDDVGQSIESLLIIAQWYAEHGGALGQATGGNHLAQQSRNVGAFQPRAEGPSRQPRQGIPALLHYHCDRGEQESQIEEALRDRRVDAPLVFIIHGDEDQCHDEFLERLRVINLPRILGVDQNNIGVKEYDIDYPSNFSNGHEFDYELLRRLGKKVHNRSWSTHQAITEVFAQLGAPVVIQARWFTDDWNRGRHTSIIHFLDFWADWPVRDLKYPILVCLIVKYQAAPEQGWRGWGQRLRYRHINGRLRAVLRSLSFTDPQRPWVVLVDELRGVTQNHLEVWSRDMYTQQFCGDRDLLAEVRALCQQPGFRDREGLVAMQKAAEALKELLAQRQGRAGWRSY